MRKGLPYSRVIVSIVDHIAQTKESSFTKDDFRDVNDGEWHAVILALKNNGYVTVTGKTCPRNCGDSINVYNGDIVRDKFRTFCIDNNPIDYFY